MADTIGFMGGVHGNILLDERVLAFIEKHRGNVSRGEYITSRVLAVPEQVMKPGTEAHDAMKLRDQLDGEFIHG